MRFHSFYTWGNNCIVVMEIYIYVPGANLSFLYMFFLYMVQIFHGTKVPSDILSDFWIIATEEIFLVSSIKYEVCNQLESISK